MTEPTDPIDPTTPDPAPPTPPAAQPPKKKKRRWLKVLAAMIVLVVLLVALLPTLLSLSPARSLVVGQAQRFVPHGKLEVGDYSLGWFSPIRATGIRLLDEQGTVVAAADEIKTDLTLLQAIRQKFNLTGTVIDAAAHVVVNPDKSTNLQHVLGLDTPAEKSPTSKPRTVHHEEKSTATKLPDVTADITLKLHGDVMLVDAAAAPVAVVRLLPGSGGTIKIPNINAPIDADLKFVYDTGDGTKPGSVGIKSTVDAIENNQIDLAKLAAKLDLPVQDVDLAGLKPLLVLAGQKDLSLAGVATGEIAGELKPGETGGIRGTITVADLGVGTPQLKDVYKAATLQIPVELSRDVVAGVSRLRLDASAIVPEASVKVTGDLPEMAIENLANQGMAGANGTVNVTLAGDLKKLTVALPRTMAAYLPGVTIDQGTFATDVTAAIRPADIQSHVKTDVTARGTRNGLAVAIEPITLVSDATLTQLAGKDAIIAGLRDVSVSFNSAFASLQVDGKTLATISGHGKADLDKAQQQVAQFRDLGKTQFSGAANFDLASSAAADPTARHATLTADVSKLHVVLENQPPIDLSTATTTAEADLVTDAGGLNVLQVKSAKVQLAANAAADSPLINTTATLAGIDINAQTIQSVSVMQCTIPSLPKLQQFIDPFVPKLREQKIELVNGSVNAAVEASKIDVKAKTFDLTRFEASLPKLRINRDGQSLLSDTIRVLLAAKSTAADGGMNVDVSTLSVKSTLATLEKGDGPLALQMPGGMPRGAGTVRFGLDAAQADRLARIFSPGSSRPQVASGRVDGTIALASVAGQSATANVDGKISDLKISDTAGGSFAFDKAKPLTFKVNATADGTDKIDGLNVSALDADLDVVRLSMVEPIKVGGLTTTPTASGKVMLAGAFDRLLPLLEVVQNADKPMPYAGRFSFTQTVAPQGGAIGLKGSGIIDDFAVLDDTGKPTVSEKQVTIANDLSADLAKQVATITSLTLDMASSKAAQVAVTGGVEDWSAQRRLKNVVVKIDAVGEKVWPIVYGLMPPAQQAQFKDAKLTGPVHVDLLANGAYPAKPTWNESAKSVVAYGGMSLKSMETMGLSVSDFVLPFSLCDNGKLITGDARKKGSARFAKPFTINNGQGDFGSIVLDVGDPKLPLSIGRKQKLLQKVELNTVLAAQLGSLASVVFKDAQDASGLIDLTVIECNNVPLLDLMNKQATASFTYNVHKLQLDGPVPSTLSKVLNWGDGGILGDIDSASLALKKGIAYQDMTIALQRQGQTKKGEVDEDGKAKTVTETMKFKGGVNLTTNKFDNYTLTLSPGLLLRDWRKSFADGATVELKGRVDDVTGILAQAVGQLAVQGYGGDAVEKLLGGLKKKKKE